MTTRNPSLFIALLTAICLAGCGPKPTSQSNTEKSEPQQKAELPKTQKGTGPKPDVPTTTPAATETIPGTPLGKKTVTLDLSTIDSRYRAIIDIPEGGKITRER